MQAAADEHKYAARVVNPFVATVLDAVQDLEAVRADDRVELLNTQVFDSCDGQMPDQTACKAGVSTVVAGLALAYNDVYIQVGETHDLERVGRMGRYLKTLLDDNPQLPFACGLLFTQHTVQAHHMVRSRSALDPEWQCVWWGSRNIPLKKRDGSGANETALRWVAHWAYEVVKLGKCQRLQFSVQPSGCKVRILSVLGTGVTSTVYRVAKVGGETEDMFALKLFQPHMPDADERADRERAVVQALSAEVWAPTYVGQVERHDSSASRGFVMELCEPLDRMTGPKFRQLMTALRVLHMKHRRCHQDVKASNLGMRGDQLVLLDFGGCVDIGYDKDYHGAFHTASDRVLTVLQRGANPAASPSDDIEAAARTAFVLSAEDGTVETLRRVPTSEPGAMLAAWQRCTPPAWAQVYSAARSTVAGSGVYREVADRVCELLRASALAMICQVSAPRLG